MSEPHQVNCDEPIGIVISRGPRGEAAPRLVAYIWGQADEAPAKEPRAA